MAARPPRPPGPPQAPWGPAFEGALQAGLSVVIGIVAGYYADRQFGTRPFLMIGLTIAGGVAAVRCLMQLTELAQPSQQELDPESPHGGAAGASVEHPLRSGESEAQEPVPGAPGRESGTRPDPAPGSPSQDRARAEGGRETRERSTDAD